MLLAAALHSRGCGMGLPGSSRGLMLSHALALAAVVLPHFLLLFGSKWLVLIV